MRTCRKMAKGSVYEGSRNRFCLLAPRRRRSVNGMPKVRSQHMVFVSLIGDHNIRGTGPAKTTPEIEADCPAVFGFDRQPGAFAVHAPAVIQGMTQQRAPPSARLARLDASRSSAFLIMPIHIIA